MFLVPSIPRAGPLGQRQILADDRKHTLDPASGQVQIESIEDSQIGLVLMQHADWNGGCMYGTTVFDRLS